ncbi:CaiB/BaiF CoA transferase family protein [Antarcticimicrobium luteum]|uniref:CoA transferase n=1 Tax=Antarcticimicrobium luteum TaxID=2547397 RepID=A0A4R5V7R8_9RHOB|nr:CoA transferase [Antarcticimicrobium luteum]TDK48128.1 CoA transferase [Antarcticimicrobium luteum]
MTEPGILDGVKVVELGQNLAGPFAGEILADLGADVVKIEKPGGDDARRWGPPITENAAAIFHLMNRNKASVMLDLKRPADRQTLEALLDEADIFLHNMRPGAIEALGLGPEAVTAAHPRLVYCDMGAFGHLGPMRARPGYEPLMQAYAGLISVNGHPDGPPARIGASIVDQGTGMWTAMGALAALLRRQRTGRGCVVNTSLLETALVWAGSHAAIYRTTGQVPPRQASGHPMLVPYQAFETAGGPLVITPGNDRLFRALARALGHPEWGEDPRFVDNEARRRHREEIVGLVAGCLRDMPIDEARAMLDAAGVPNAPVHSIPQIFEDPQVQALGLFQTAPGLDVEMTGLPISFDGTRPAIRRAAPGLGADTADRKAAAWPADDQQENDDKC